MAAMALQLHSGLTGVCVLFYPSILTVKRYSNPTWSTTELLVAHLCANEIREECTAVMDNNDSEFIRVYNTQGYVHEWPLPVARHFRSSYHFRLSVAGQAHCSTDPNYVGILFTDYHFNFYRRCQ